MEKWFITSELSMPEPCVDVLALMDVKRPSGRKVFDVPKASSIVNLLSFISDAKKSKQSGNLFLFLTL